MALTKVTSGVIAANAVVDSFGSQSITGDKIGLTAINANNIVDSSITSAKIDTVANSKITGTITTAQIADGAVTTAKLAPGAIPETPQIVKPTITSPANNATDILNTQLITATPFLSLYGHTQSNAQWQLSTSSEFAFINVENTISGSNTQFQINASSGLVESQTYYARVRYGDTATPNNTSQYSDTVNFTTASTFPFIIEYLVIAGGGGGGSSSSTQQGGGAGAGGYRSSVSGESSGGGAPSEPVFLGAVSTPYTVTIGSGGAGSTTAAIEGSLGSNSVFATITAFRGGVGGSGSNPGSNRAGSSGGSGGGSGGSDAPEFPGGSGTPGQGYGGGLGATSYGGGGTGGGAGGAGDTQPSPVTSTGISGGLGVASSITGTPVTRAVGGKVRGSSEPGDLTGPSNTGNGGGGGFSPLNPPSAGSGSNGGSGVVIIKYSNAFTMSNPSGGLTFSHSPAVPGFNVTTFTAGTGSIEFN